MSHASLFAPPKPKPITAYAIITPDGKLARIELTDPRDTMRDGPANWSFWQSIGWSIIKLTAEAPNDR